MILSGRLSNNASHQRFESLCQQSEVEGLSVLCKVMTLHDSAIDIVALHISILHVLANLLAFIESFDCESVGKSDRYTYLADRAVKILFFR